MHRINERTPHDYQQTIQHEPGDVNEDIRNSNHVEPQVEELTADIKMHDEEDVDDVQTEVNYHSVDVNVREIPSVEQKKPQRKKRSAGARRKRNQKRNKHFKLLRYKYPINRPYYYKVRSRMAKKILQEYGIKPRHIKKRNGLYVIGLQNEHMRIRCEEQLPQDCFNKVNYEQFRK